MMSLVDDIPPRGVVNKPFTSEPHAKAFRTARVAHIGGVSRRKGGKDYGSEKIRRDDER